MSPTLLFQHAIANVKRMAEERDELESLAGEMLATLQLPKNAEHFKHLPETWHQLVASWRRKFDSIGPASGNPPPEDTGEPNPVSQPRQP